jgi:hypothetical protein
MSRPFAYLRDTLSVSQVTTLVGKFGAHTLIACLFLQNIFTLSTQTLTYPASQLISSAIYHHKFPIFFGLENIPAPPQIKLSSSSSSLSLSSVKQPGESPD